MGGYSSEVKAILGLDTSKMPADAAKAVEAFKSAAKEIEKEGEKAGAGAGDKLVNSLEHRILGARHLSGALATALGLNIEKVSEKIAGAITGGAKEGWKEALEISNQNAKLIESIIEARLSPKQLQAKHQQDLDRAIRGVGSEGPDNGTAAREGIVAGITGGGPGTEFLNGFIAMMGIGNTKAEELKEKEVKVQAVLESQAKVEEDHRKTTEEILALEDQTLTAKEKQGTLQERNDAILDHVYKLEQEIASGKLTDVEVSKKKLEIENKFIELAALQKEQREHELESQRRIVELETKRNELAEHRLKLAKDEAKLTDRNKLTVGELAQLTEGKKAAKTGQAAIDDANRAKAFSFGRDADLSSAELEARDKAEKIQELEARAELARKSGDQGATADINAQVGTLRDDLVKSGFTKSTENDPATALREQIAKDNVDIKKILSSIELIEQGKYVNQ